MQILRQALLQKLSTSIILFKVLRNKILCLTQFQLIVLSIDEGCKKMQIPYSGTNVWAIEMSKNYIAILQRSGNLEIRRLQNIKQVTFTHKNIKIANTKYPKLKWWEDDLHLVYQKKHDQISIPKKLFSSFTLPFQVKPLQTLIQMEFCDLFSDMKTIFYVMSSSIHMCLDGFKLGSIELENQEIKQILRLCHPLQANQFKKQYIVVLTESRQGNSETKRSFLKVYNILNMDLIFSKQLYKPKDQQIEISCDQLCEYLLLKYFKGKTSNSLAIQSQNLMKINAEHYYSHNSNYFENSEPFFCFDILIGLTKDLKLFPSHSQKIKGKLCNSIDTCYFEKNQIFIASIVLQASYKDETFKTYKQIQIFSASQNDSTNNSTDIMMWKQIVQAKIDPQSWIDKITKSICFKNSSKAEMQTPFCVDIGIEQQKMIQDLLFNLNKINKFSDNNFNKAYLMIKKIIAIEYFPMLMDVASIEKDCNKKTREMLEKSNEDFVNTMSGFSSSQSHSPRSIQSSAGCQSQKSLLEDLSKESSRKNTGKENEQFCKQCSQIQDNENLELISFIEEESSKKASNVLTKIQEQIHKMETLCKFRLQKMEIKTRRQKKTEQNIVLLIEDEFQKSLKNISLNLMRQTQAFTQKLAQKTQTMTLQQTQASQYVQKLQDARLNYENDLKIHKDSKEELLDYLYDIEFPDLGMEMYQQTSFSSAQNHRQLRQDENSLTRDMKKRTLGMKIEKNQSQEFKLFSQFVLKNFI